MIQYVDTSDNTDGADADAEAYGWPPYGNRTDDNGYGYGKVHMNDLSLIFAFALFACTGLKVTAYFVDRYSRTRVARVARVARAREQVVVHKVKLKSRVITQGSLGLGLAGGLLNECPICLEEFSVGDVVSELTCHHPFHRDCLTLWMQENHTCPLCRLPV